MINNFFIRFFFFYWKKKVFLYFSNQPNHVQTDKPREKSDGYFNQYVIEKSLFVFYPINLFSSKFSFRNFQLFNFFLLLMRNALEKYLFVNA